MKTVRVIAAPVKEAPKGTARVVKEGTLRRFITESEPVEVPLSRYYQRKISRGELFIVKDEPARKSARADKE